jgi:hypothetical protein
MFEVSSDQGLSGCEVDELCSPKLSSDYEVPVQGSVAYKHYFWGPQRPAHFVRSVMHAPLTFDHHLKV